MDRKTESTLMTSQPHAYAVILAGGGGTRLWPKSRNKTPKQFLKLVGPKTMMQVAADRVAQLVDWDKIIVVTNMIYAEEVQKQLPQIPTENIIAEPEKKDTALAMLVGALFAKSKDPEAVILNAASDHTVIQEKEFARIMRVAVETAAQGNNLVTVGILPTFPTSAFGYIQIGQELKSIDTEVPLFKVDNFREKPDVETAKAFIATGKYFWNANMYVWSAKALQEAFKTHMPELYERTQNLDTLSSEDFHATLPQVYKDATAISIDYAISEKADNLVLIPGDFGWSDVGDWKVVYDLGTKNNDGNVVTGDGEEENTLAIASHNNLIHVNGKLVALVGIEDMIIVDTEEILMICPKDKSQDVKKLVEKLKEENRKEYL